MFRFEAAPEAVMLPVADVVNLHNLIMGGIRQQQILRGRKVRVELFPREYKFCMFGHGEDTPTSNTGSTDTYMNIRLAKPRMRYWSMMISFLEGKNNVEEALCNNRIMYRMDWTPTAALGITWNTETLASSRSQGYVGPMEITAATSEVLSFTGKSSRLRSEAQYMSQSDVADIYQRVNEISEAVMMTDGVTSIDEYIELSGRELHIS